MTNFVRRYASPVGLLPVCFVLASCGVTTNHSADFRCEAELGTPCTTIAQADGSGGGATSARNVVPVNGNSVTPRPQRQGTGLFYNQGKAAGNAALSNPEWPNGAAGGTRNLAASRYNAQSQRVPERLGTLWVASYLDNDNVLHDASYVHFVIQEAGWAGVH